MQLIMCDRSQPSTPGVYWVQIDSHLEDYERTVAQWTGEEWVYSEHSPEHLWGVKIEGVIGWISEEEYESVEEMDFDDIIIDIDDDVETDFDLYCASQID